MTKREKMIVEAWRKEVGADGFRRRLERWMSLNQTETKGDKFRYNRYRR